MHENRDMAVIKVFKYDPAIDEESRYETYNASYKGMTVLNVLKSIYNKFDAELAFRWGCEGAGDCRCGACAMTVNDTPVLACRRAAEAEMVIAPHPRFEIIRDLVVDFSKDRSDIPENSASVRIAIDSEKCVKCADCISICPVGVFETQKGEFIPVNVQFCCGDSCKQCVTYCQANAITVHGD